jgi:hypothetical protein
MDETPKKKMMRVRVQNSGESAWNTHIIDVETGKELEYVSGQL